MATEHHGGFRSEVLLDPSQYTIVIPPVEVRQGKTKRVRPQPEVISHFIPIDLSEQNIRDVLHAWVQTQPLLSPDAVRRMAITEIGNEVIYQYTLESYTERRSVCLRYEPACKGSVNVSPTEEHKEQRPWKVPVTPGKMFTNQMVKYRLSHTDYETACPVCHGQEWVICKECLGSTRMRCTACRGRGRNKKCAECMGERTVQCRTCMALGRLCCETCVGKGHLCYFKEMLVEYTYHMERALLGEQPDIPVEKLTKAGEVILHTDTGPKVRPITSFHKEEVNAASLQIVQASHTKWPDSRIVQQKHLLTAIPIIRVKYSWRNTSGSIFIYGVNHSIYWPNYPQNRISLCCPCLGLGRK